MLIGLKLPLGSGRVAIMLGLKKKVLVVGANGKIGRRVTRLLAVRGHAVAALVRDREVFAGAGIRGDVEVREGDLEEEDLTTYMDGIGAVVFTAGSGGKTGGDKTLLVDLYGAIKCTRAAERTGISQFVMVSALKSDHPDAGPERIRHYLVAKMVADDYLRRSGLNYVILRPGTLTDEPGTGLVQAALRLEERDGKITRDDVAEMVVRCLERPDLRRVAFDLLNGSQPIDEAIDTIIAG